MPNQTPCFFLQLSQTSFLLNYQTTLSVLALVDIQIQAIKTRLLSSSTWQAFANGRPISSWLFWFAAELNIVQIPWVSIQAVSGSEALDGRSLSKSVEIVGCTGIKVIF